MSILNKEKILEQAKIFMEEGKYDRAISEYEKIILADPSDLRVKLRIAELYAKRKQISEAIRVYREVAVAYAEEGFFLKAVTVYKNILRLNPSLIEINEQLAKLYERMGILPDAVRQYDIVASSLEGRKDAARVLDIRSKIVQLVPEDERARIRLAEAYQLENQMEKALDQYEALLHALEKKEGTETKRVELYEKVLSHRPDRGEMLRELIHIYYRRNEKQKALKWLEAGKAFTASDAELLSMQAEIYVSLNQFETARTHYLTLAELESEHGNIEGALAAYGSILIIMPNEAEKLAEKIEGLGEGAVDALRAWLDRRREALAHQLREKEEASATIDAQERQREAEVEKAKKEQGDRERQERIRKLQEGLGASPPSPAKSTLIKPPDPVVTKPSPEVKKASAPLPSSMSKGKQEDAEAAFVLGQAYRKMGLIDEAKGEFEKAKSIYHELQRLHQQDAQVSARLTELEQLLGGKPHNERTQVAPPPPSPPSPVVPLPSPAAVETHEKATEQFSKKKLPPSLKGKKKISFV